jgi:hypothetical protein
MPFGRERVQAGQEELVVDAQAVQLGLELEPQALRAEGRVADVQQRLAVRQRHLLQPGVQDGLLRIERPGDPRGKAVELDPDKARAAGDIPWHQPDEVAGASRQLQAQAAAEPEALHAGPDRVDHRAGGVVGVAGGRSRRPHLLRGEQAGQLVPRSFHASLKLPSPSVKALARPPQPT